MKVVLISIAMLGVSTSCRPGYFETPSVVGLEGRSNGWSALVPLCSGDGISSWQMYSSLAESKDAIELRWSTVEEQPDRFVRLVVDPMTLESGKFNPAEVEVVSKEGDPTDPSKLVSALVTSRGFADWRTETISNQPNRWWIATGDSRLRSVTKDGMWDELDRVCRSRN